MEKKIRSISISEIIDSKLIDDSKSRGLTISANISRILFDYFKEETKGSGKILRVDYFNTTLLIPLSTSIGINVSI